MGVFHVFWIVQMVPNRATHHRYAILNKSKYWAKNSFSREQKTTHIEEKRKTADAFRVDFNKD